MGRIPQAHPLGQEGVGPDLDLGHVMFAKHLPPSVGLPRVLALDDRAASELPAEVELTRAPAEAGIFDAVVGVAPPDAGAQWEVARWLGCLRPGGRLILAAPAEALLAALTAAGYVHCLVEALEEGLVLCRGERPPTGSSVERVQALSTSSRPPLSPFLFLLVRQTPNRPAWELSPDEKVEWQAATMIDPTAGRPVLLAFSSLVKAVAFMQPAVLAGFPTGVNKVGKFRAEVVQAWAVSYVLNPAFDAWSGAALGPLVAVDPQLAITGEV